MAKLYYFLCTLVALFAHNASAEVRKIESCASSAVASKSEVLDFKWTLAGVTTELLDDYSFHTNLHNQTLSSELCTGLWKFHLGVIKEGITVSATYKYNYTDNTNVNMYTNMTLQETSVELLSGVFLKTDGCTVTAQEQLHVPIRRQVQRNAQYGRYGGAYPAPATTYNTYDLTSEHYYYHTTPGCPNPTRPTGIFSFGWILKMEDLKKVIKSSLDSGTPISFRFQIEYTEISSDTQDAKSPCPDNNNVVRA